MVRKVSSGIYRRVVEVLKEKLSKDEWVELSDRLDSDPDDGFLAAVNEHVAVIAPEIFAGKVAGWKRSQGI